MRTQGTVFDSHQVEELWYNPQWRITTVVLNGHQSLLFQLRHPRFGFLDLVVPWHEAQLLASALQIAEDRALKATPSAMPPAEPPQ